MYSYDWLILAGYFLVKNYFFYEYIKPFKSETRNLALSISTAIIAIFFNYLNESTYTSYSEMTLVRGAIVLPAFVVVYIGADFLSSLVALIYLKFFLGQVIRKPITGLMEFMRFFLLHAIFVVIIESSWQSNYTERFVNTKYICFISQLRYDIAVYTLNNNKYPTSISEASSLSVNPHNNSKIIIINNKDTGTFEVKDEFGNKIVDSLGFIGILDAQDDKSKQTYLNLYKLPLKEACAER